MRVAGLSPPVEITGFNNSINTLERAVKERVFYVKKNGVFQEPPRPEKLVFAYRLLNTRLSLAKFLPSTVPLTRLEFVETFRGRKRKIYEAAYADLLGRSLSIKDSFIKVFTKYEKVNFTDKVDPVPRVVSPRSPRYNIEVGRYLRPIEERIFSALAGLYEGHRVVFKGMNALLSARVMREKWDMFKNPVAVSIDARRWDQHVSVPALHWEHDVYLGCFRGHHKRALRRLLAMQLHNRCRGWTEDGSVKYDLKGGRMSGDMNTSLGNCVLACALVHAYALFLGIRVQLANNGDDCVVFMERCDLGRFQQNISEWFLEMGFDLAVEDPCFQFEQIDFCQTHPVMVDGEWLMVRNPRTGLAKDTVCVHNYVTGREFLGWLHSVGTGGMAMSGGVPIFQEFYAAYLRAGVFWKGADSGQSWGVKHLSMGMKREYSPPSPSTRASFYWAYGITPDEQVVIEDYYKSVDISASHRVMTFRLPMPE